jgi:hypothetical protein
VNVEVRDEVSRCKCGKIVRMQVGVAPMCALCRRAAERSTDLRSFRKQPKPEEHVFQQMSAREVVSEYCSMLNYMGILEPSGACVQYKPGDDGFDLIAMQYI